jgi:stage II sporulation protein D
VVSRRAFKLSFLFCLFFFFLSWAFGRCSEARNIYVRLADKPPRILLTSEKPITLTDGSKKKYSLGKSVTLIRSGSSVTVGKNKYPLPLSVSSGGLLGFNGRKYRGEFLVTKGFVLINVLDVEDYLRGVLPAEASSRWPHEALKAQAIISRTYGLRQSLNRLSRGYDVSDTSSDQVYKGAGVEIPVMDQAIRETAGEVLAYGDALALTFYHSDSGGHTAANVHVWGRDIPYLTGVAEPIAYQSPHSSWTARISASQVQAALAKAGGGVGPIKEIRVTDLTPEGAR